MLRQLSKNVSRNLPVAKNLKPVLNFRQLSLAPAITKPMHSKIFYCNRIGSIRFNSSAQFKPENQQMMIAFTCKKCDTRSSHTFSKQAYTKGTVAIQCPGCKNRHLIADNLKIFDDNKFNLEDILRARGESVDTTTNDLVFEDIPESLKGTLGHYAKDAPEEYSKEENDNDTKGLPNK